MRACWIPSMSGTRYVLAPPASSPCKRLDDARGGRMEFEAHEQALAA